MYRLIHAPDGKLTGIFREKGRCHIPINPGNRQYREFLEWNYKQVIPLVLEDKHAPITEPAEALESRIEKLEKRLAKLEGAS